MIKIICYLGFSFFIFTSLSAQEKLSPYLDLPAPGETSEIFAKNIVSTELNERDIAIHPNGKEIYFSINSLDHNYSTIFLIKKENDKWGKPEVMENLNNPEHSNSEPHISPDGKKFYFYSNRPHLQNGEDISGGADIWVMDRDGEKWGKPYNVGAPVNSVHKEFFPSVTKDGKLYFCRAENGSRVHHIYRSEFKDGKYLEPEMLPKEVNSGSSQFNALVSPDESFIIVPTAGREDSFGSVDYYISYRNEDDSWDGPYNLGNQINSRTWLEYSPALSPDGKYFFFMSSKRNLPNTNELTYKELIKYNFNVENGNTDIYWIDAKVLKKEFVTGGENAK